MAKLLSEVLKQATITLNEGDYLATYVHSEGYLPSREDTVNLAQGKVLFKVIAADGGKHVVPVEVGEGGKGLVEVKDRPIIRAKGTEIVYTVGRNHPTYRDGYQGRGFDTVTGIKAEALDREILIAFLQFANTEYSLGVNDFRLGGEELLDLGTPTPPVGG